MVAVALELQHAVDEVLEHPRAGDRAVLRHVADEEVATPASFATRSSRAAASRTCETDPGAEPTPATRASARSRSRRRRAARARASRRRLELGLRQDLDLVAPTEPRGAELDLRRRLLARDEERPAPRRDRPERASAAASTCRRQARRRRARARRDEPAAEHAVELRRRRWGSARHPRRQRRRGEAAAAGPALAPSGAARGKRLGHHGPELAAARAAPEPAARRRAALGARVLDGRRLRHAVTVAGPPDGACAGSGTIHPHALPPRLERARRLEIALGSWPTYGGGVPDDQARACVEAGAGARERSGVGDARRGDARRDRRDPPVDSRPCRAPGCALKARWSSAAARSRPRSGPVSSMPTGAPASPRSSRRSGTARRSARCSGPSSWPSCRPTTGPSTRTQSSGPTSRARDSGKHRTSTSSASPHACGTGAPARPRSRAATTSSFRRGTRRSTS